MGAPLPLWHEGTLPGFEPRDVAAAVNGTVVGWTPTLLDARGARFAMLLTEPLLAGATGPPTLHEIDGDCLRPLVT